MVVFDSSVLLLVLDPKAKPPVDSATGESVARAPERIDRLIEELSAAKEKIIIPTPVLCEVLVRADAAMSEYLDALNRNAAFRIVPFDQKAAIEAAIAMNEALNSGGLRANAPTADVKKSKIKFDRQIVAIAKAEGAHTVYSDDKDVHSYASRAGLKAIRTADLDLPPEDPQGALGF